MAKINGTNTSAICSVAGHCTENEIKSLSCSSWSSWSYFIPICLLNLTQCKEQHPLTCLERRTFSHETVWEPEISVAPDWKDTGWSKCCTPATGTNLACCGTSFRLCLNLSSIDHRCMLCRRFPSIVAAPRSGIVVVSAPDDHYKYN